MNKRDYDQLLRIKTVNLGVRLDQSFHYNHYEATSYPTLHTLFQEYKLDKTDGFVDFGSGKGRILFYVHNLFHASVTGIEMNEQLYKTSLKNQTTYMKKVKSRKNPIRIECCLAQDYEIKETENKFYFFNPFSVQIFMKVVGNILRSVEKTGRDVDIILYYPTKEYIQYLEVSTPFELMQEVRIPGLYTINDNERFVIFRFEG